MTVLLDSPAEQRGTVLTALEVIRDFLSRPVDARRRQLVVDELRSMLATEEHRCDCGRTFKTEAALKGHVTRTHGRPGLDLTGFDAFWDVYPRRNGLPKGNRRMAEDLWAKLSMDDRRAAYRAAKNLAVAVEKAGRLPRDAERFLTNRYWEMWKDKVTIEPTRPSWVPANAVPDGYGGWQV